MSYRITTPTVELLIEADEHRIEGQHHVFRRTTTVMGSPRVVVVRRLAVADVTTVTRH